MFQENHILSADEIKQYQKEGKNLDPKKMYVIKFLFNDKWNEAADPRPFRIKPSLIQKLAIDSIEMPYVINPNNTNRHLRGPDGNKPDTARGLLEIQAKYSIGLIKVPLITPTNNVYGIIEVWPEYEKLVESGELPPFTSPTIFPMKEDADGIEEGQFLNINAVGIPGYVEILSGTHGVCKNGIKECMSELAPLAASGSLKQQRENSSNFLNSLSSLHVNMSADQNTTQPSIETVVKDVENIKSELSSIRQEVGSQKTLLESIASKVGADKPADPTGMPMGAAGEQKLIIPKELKDNEFVKTLFNSVKESQSEVEIIKKERQAEKDKITFESRKAHATSIVEKQILLKQVKPDEKVAKIKEYMELKAEDGNLKDLEVLDNYLKSTISSEPDADAIGAGGLDAPEIHGDQIIEISNSEVMGFNV